MAEERKIDEIHQTCDEACEILQATNDGDELHPLHLKLLEHAVNGFLSDHGKECFRKLLANVRAGYQRNGEPTFESKTPEGA